MTPIIANIAQPLIDVVDWMLVAIHGIVGGSWGYAIIVLTLLVRLAVMPLALTMARSMRQMAAVAPELKALQVKYADDKQRQQQEIMKFYAERKINPFASCFPLLLQIPVFIALFYTLKDDLKRDVCPGIGAYAASVKKEVADVPCSKVPGAADSAQFLFIPDLTAEPLGVVATVLILLLGASSLLTALAMAGPRTPAHRQIALASPIAAAGFFIYAGLPAGLVVYWTTSNVWTAFQSRQIQRATGVAPAPVLSWRRRNAVAGSLGKLAPPAEGKISVSDWLRGAARQTTPPIHGEMLAFADWHEGHRELARAPDLGVDSLLWLMRALDLVSERTPSNAQTCGSAMDALHRAYPEHRTTIARLREEAEARRGPASARLLAMELLKKSPTLAAVGVGGTAFAIVADAFLGELAPLAPAIEIPLAIGAINAAMDAARPNISLARLPPRTSIALALIPLGLTAGATIVYLSILDVMNASIGVVVGLGALSSLIGLSAAFRILTKLKPPKDWLAPDPANIGRPT